MKSLFTFAVFTILSISTLAQIPSGSVCATVIQRDAETPIIGAVITISQNGNYVVSGITDTLGKCRITDLATGSYHLTAEYLGRQWQSTLIVMNGKTTLKDIIFTSYHVCFPTYITRLPEYHDAYGSCVSLPSRVLQNLMP